LDANFQLSTVNGKYLLLLILILLLPYFTAISIRVDVKGQKVRQSERWLKSNSKLQLQPKAIRSQLPEIPEFQIQELLRV
jgi:hypothetical protein